jgi:hypothetical protein
MKLPPPCKGLTLRSEHRETFLSLDAANVCPFDGTPVAPLDAGRHYAPRQEYPMSDSRRDDPMRRLNSASLLALLTLVPAAAYAQDKPTAQAVRKIDRILTEFNDEMRGYERELKYFQRVPEFAPLLELRSQLLAQAMQIRQLDTAGRGSGPAILEAAREMDRTVRQLDAQTSRLQKHADAVSKAEGRVVAARMLTHANRMVKIVDQLIVMFR